MIEQYSGDSWVSQLKTFRATLGPLQDGGFYELSTRLSSDSGSAIYTVSLHLGEHEFKSNPEDSTKLYCACGATVPVSGKCGTNVEWNFKDGVLTISGTGPMKNYSNYNPSTAPWYLFRKNITSVVVESGVTSIGEYAFYNCTNLKTVYWNAADASFSSTYQSTGGVFQVVLGDTVERFTQDELDVLIRMGCNSLELPQSSYLTLTALKAGFLPAVLADLSQAETLYYVDGQGVLYRIEDHSAYLAYCPAGIAETYTVPAELPAEDGQEIARSVAGVDTYAFYEAELTALTFEAPQNITRLKDCAFNGAGNLVSINSMTTEADVLGSFTKLTAENTGVSLFAGTKITRSTDTGEDIVYENGTLKLAIKQPSQGVHPQWHEADSGVFRYYTGETAATQITVDSLLHEGEGDGSAVVRVYYRMDDANGRLENYQPEDYPGKTYDIADSTVKVNVFRTSVPNCYCFELHLQAGDTASFTLNNLYPSSTGGGSATVWGAILTEEQAATLGSGLASGSQSHTIHWETQRGTYRVTKFLYDSKPKLVNNGSEGAYLNGLYYEIKVIREDTPLAGGYGADPVKSVDITDTLTLPEGARFTEAVCDAVRNGTYTVSNSSSYCYFKLPNGTAFLRTWGKNDPYASLTLLSNSELKICWNSGTGARLYVGDNVVEVPSLDQLPEDWQLTVNNHVDAVIHYAWSGDTTSEADCETTVTPTDGSLVLSKKFGTLGDSSVARYPGEAIPVRITASNPGTRPYSGLAYLEDPMPKEVYLSAEQLAEAFADQTDGTLTVTITGATLCTPVTGQTVTGIDGTTTGVTGQQNTAAENRYSGLAQDDTNKVTSNATITLAWAGDGQNLTITATAEENISLPSPQICAPNAEDIQAALENLGYLVTYDAQYTLLWKMPENYRLFGSGELEKLLYATYKDTFMALQQDMQFKGTTARPIAESRYRWNYVYAYNADRIEIGKGGKSNLLYAKCTYMEKGWSCGGQPVTQATQLEAGSVLDYQLTVQEPGNGTVGLLPLVDQMQGAQVLLVPKALNKNQAWAEDCPTVAVDTVEYYSLEQEQTYKNVWTAQDQMADQVVVESADNGLTTRIYWYFTNFSGPYSTTVNYKAQVRPGLASGITFALKNESWLGDHETHRIYDTVGWTGSVIKFSKKIVPTVGDANAQGETHSIVHEGESVVYRLRVENIPDAEGVYSPVTLKGADILDDLPQSLTSCPWIKDSNVKIEYATDVTDGVTNAGSWSVESVGNQQKIVWGQDFQMTFTVRADIFVTLTFPSGEGWDAYAAAYGSAELRNTFFLLGGADAVTHELSLPVAARLQKGVVGGAYLSYRRGGWDSDKFEVSYSQRTYYQNRGLRDYGVLYYVSLCNEGPGRLYLTEMQDRLPRGFTLSSYYYKLPGESSSSIGRPNRSGVSYSASGRVA